MTKLSILALGFLVAVAAPPLAAQSAATIATVAGTGTGGFSGDGAAATAAQLNSPRGVFVDSSGNLYIADRTNNRIRRVDADGVITTVAGTGGDGYTGDGGQATAALFSRPDDMAADSAGHLYIADSFNARVRRVDSGTGVVSSVASGQAPALLARPFAVFVDSSDNLYIANTLAHNVLRRDSMGTLTRFIGDSVRTGGFYGDGGQASAARLNQPYDMTADAAGNLYVADNENNRIRRVDTMGVITTFAGTGTRGFSGDGGQATAADLDRPIGLAMDSRGNLYIADWGNHRIRRVDADGVITTVAGTGTAGYSGDGAAAASAQLNRPHGLDFDSSGDLYIGDSNNHRIRKVTFPPPPPEPESPGGGGARAPAPPVAVGMFEDAALDLGGRLEVPLLGKFSAPAGGALGYSAASSHANVADARVVNGRVLVRAFAPGAARVTVTATTAEGLSASHVFVVRVGVVVSFAADASAPEGETLRLRLVASQPAPRDLDIAWELAAGEDTARAADESDHDGGSGGVATIAAGETEAAIEIAILDDEQVEPAREFFAVALSAAAADAGYGLGLKVRAEAVIEEGVCDRAAPVRDALRGPRDCAAVADPSSLRSLNLAGLGIDALREEDFFDLSGLRVLDLSRNRLSAWPGAVLKGLANLIDLRLSGNLLQGLPAGALAANRGLIGLNLADNRLSALPAEGFRELAALQVLDLSGNALAALPGDVFRGLAGLRQLLLNDNRLSALPAGLFAGVSGLRMLHLQDNPGAPFMLAVELARTDAEPWVPGPATVSARVAEGAPFALRALMTASRGSLPEAVALEIAAGAAESASTTVPQLAAGAVWVRLAGAPPAPGGECEMGEWSYVACFQGIGAAAGEPLALFKRPPSAVGAIAPQALGVDGDALRLSLAEQFQAAPGEALAWAAESSDPAVARARIENGVLIAEAVGEGAATITVTATDSDGLSATLSFAVRGEHMVRSRFGGWRLIALDPEGSE